VAAGKKNAARLGAHIVFVDESGFLLIPSVRRTWAPRGVTPLHHHWSRHDRISVISGVSVSPRRRRIGLYYQLHLTNIHQTEACAFVRLLLRHLRGPVIVVWDNGNIHQGDPVRALCRAFPRLRLERFPPYAPELNPDEGVWTTTKRTLANGRPDCQDELAAQLITALEELRRNPRNLRACITGSDLPPFLP
jgi:transposase